SPLSAERRRRLAAAAYIGADVAGDLGNASNVLAELRRGEVEVQGSLVAAVAASAFLLNADGDVATAHRLLVGAIDSRVGVNDAPDPAVAEALYSLLTVCAYAGEEHLWQPFEDAMARTEGIPVALDLNSRIFANPAHAEGTALEALDSAIAALASESDPAQIVRIGMSASHVDRIDGCRGALGRVVEDARRGGAVASGILAMIQLAHDDFKIGQWEEAEQLAEEALAVCEANGYENTRWPCRYVHAVVAAAQGNDSRVQEL